jgi:hypothetical protein
MQLDHKPLFEMGTWAGRRQAFGVIANKCSAADAECLKNLREGKHYKSFGMTWEEFCPQHVGISRTQADRLISQLEEFGAAYFDLSKQMRIPAEAFRDISGSIVENSIEYNGEKIPISTEHSHRIAEVVSALRRDPLHGGNVDMIGWQLIGYPGPLMSYRDDIEKFHGKPFRRKPLSLSEVAAHSVKGWEEET